MRYDPHDSRWMTAASRAIEDNLRTSKFLCQAELQTPGVEGYLVESSRKDGSWYVVELHRNVISVDVVCSCNAVKKPEKPMPCKHAAKVLLREGLFVSVKLEPMQAQTRKAA